jgi:hypothetical protein
MGAGGPTRQRRGADRSAGSNFGRARTTKTRTRLRLTRLRPIPTEELALVALSPEEVIRPCRAPCRTHQSTHQSASKRLAGRLGTASLSEADARTRNGGTPSLRVMDRCPLQSAPSHSAPRFSWGFCGLGRTGGAWRGQPGGRLVDVLNVVRIGNLDLCPGGLKSLAAPSRLTRKAAKEVEELSAVRSVYGRTNYSSWLRSQSTSKAAIDPARYKRNTRRTERPRMTYHSRIVRRTPSS